MGNLKDNATRVLFWVPTVYLKAWDMFAYFSSLSEDRMLWALSLRFWQCSWGRWVQNRGIGAQTSRILGSSRCSVAIDLLGKLSCSLISKVETLIILVLSSKD